VIGLGLPDKRKKETKSLDVGDLGTLFGAGLIMRLVLGLRKSRDASQPVNLSSVNLRWSVEWFWAVVYLSTRKDRRKSYGYTPRGFTQNGRRRKKRRGRNK